MTSRYRFAVEYLGTEYAGWQIQVGHPTVEEELEKALSVCLRTPVNIVGAGRTDAGVHATGQVAHFDFDGALDPRKVERSVNALVSDNIRIRRLEACSPEFHARFDAVSRQYLYRIALRPTALYKGLSWYSGFALHHELFQRELAVVEGIHDFVNFSVPRKDGKSTDCNVLKAEARVEGNFLMVRIEADRFLHKMVRATVGACFEVARNAKPPGLVQSIFDGAYAGEWTWAPARGLCLEKVVYKDYEF